MRGLPLLAAFLCACSPAYVFQAWRGHHRLVSRQKPIDAVLADPSTPPALADKLRLVKEVRAFAFDRLGIPPTPNYSTYVPVEGPAVTYAVSAARRTRLEPKTWWFPVIGRVPYKGYFRRDDAERDRAELERKGWDAIVSGVAAYSTLRWSRDPVVSSMLDGSPGEIAETLLHELTHTFVFFKGQVDFDEALATFVGRDAAEDFLSARFGPASAELAEHRRRAEDEARRAAAFDELYRELEALYGSARPDAEKLAAREAVFSRYRPRVEARVLNNAVVLAERRYDYDLSEFREARRRCGGDWRRTLERLRDLDARRPREALRAWLRRPA